MAQYLAMDGYAAYVWPAYGVSAVVLIGLLWYSLRAWHRHRQILAALEAAARSARPRGNRVARNDT